VADRNGRNGIPRRERWLGAALDRWGAVLVEREGGVLVYALCGELASFLRRDRLAITFQKRLAAQGKGELASAGSWLHDQLLRFSRERGSVAEVYLPPLESTGAESMVRSRRRGVIEVGEAEERRYGTVFLFTYRISYYSDPAEEQILHVGVDAQRRRVFTRAAARLLTRCETEAHPDFAGPPRADVKDAFRRTWGTVAEAVEGRVQTLTEAGRASYQRRIRTVENYYRQLLDEENRLYKSRSSRRGQEESRDRIELLKLEWERRVKEETERLRPQVVASLAAVSRLYVPLERRSCRLRNGGEPEDRKIWVDVSRGDVWEAAPPRGGNGNR
jgi:hypothetical protein